MYEFHSEMVVVNTNDTLEKDLQLIHLDMETMNWARNLFGLTFGIRSRNRAPKKGDHPVTLHHG
jgi:hypothetical protein